MKIIIFILQKFLYGYTAFYAKCAAFYRREIWFLSNNRKCIELPRHAHRIDFQIQSRKLKELCDCPSDYVAHGLFRFGFASFGEGPVGLSPRKATGKAPILNN
jgi:hypothetical protein